MNFSTDLYFRKDYADLYLREGESVFEFRYDEGTSFFKNLSIKRPITRIGNMKPAKAYYDLETAYGYGGFVTSSADEGFVQRATQAYSEHCVSENVIAEFIRFHPFNSFPVHFGNNFDFLRNDRETVYIDTTLPTEARWQNYSQTTRNILRKCKENLKFQESQDIESFVALYKRTMDKNAASDFYYFDREYFEKLLKLGDIKLFEVIHDGNVISMSFFILGRDLVYYHLSANHDQFYHLNANYFILDQIAEQASSWGKKGLFLGGGRSADPQDSLFKFKAKFSNLTAPFYIGGKVYNRQVFDEYKQIFETEFPDKRELKMFLKYRGGTGV